MAAITGFSVLKFLSNATSRDLAVFDHALIPFVLGFPSARNQGDELTEICPGTEAVASSCKHGDGHLIIIS